MSESRPAYTREQFDAWTANAESMNEATRGYGGEVIDVAGCVSNPDDLLYDIMHPNADGCAVEAKIIAHAILPTLRRQQGEEDGVRSRC